MIKVRLSFSQQTLENVYKSSENFSGVLLLYGNNCCSKKDLHKNAYIMRSIMELGGGE